MLRDVTFPVGTMAAARTAIWFVGRRRRTVGGCDVGLERSHVFVNYNTVTVISVFPYGTKTNFQSVKTKLIKTEIICKLEILHNLHFLLSEWQFCDKIYSSSLLFC